jgi:hypothetical protein
VHTYLVSPKEQLKTKSCVADDNGSKWLCWSVNVSQWSYADKTTYAVSAHLDELLSCDDIVHVQVKLAEQVTNGHETSSNTLKELGIAQCSDLHVNTTKGYSQRKVDWQQLPGTVNILAPAVVMKYRCNHATKCAAKA